LTRELLFENVRLQKFPDYPSRLHCFWLSDKNNLIKWLEEDGFKDKVEKEIFKVKATGIVFECDGSFINFDTIRFSDYNRLAYDYWNGSRTNKCKLEILFEGKLDIVAKYSSLEKLNDNEYKTN